MKFIYKLMIVSVLYLLSNTVNAQISQYTENGKKACLDCEEKNNTSIESCFCLGIFQLKLFEYYMPSTNGSIKDEWLKNQEKLLTKAMNGSVQQNFNDVQKAYFKKHETNDAGKAYYNKVDKKISGLAGYHSDLLESSSINYSVLKFIKDQGGIDYGDLKYNGKLLRNMNINEITSALEKEIRIRHEQRMAYEKYKEWDDRLSYAKNVKLFEDLLAQEYIDHYNGLSHEEAIRFMTRYMVAINSNHYPYVYEPFGNLHNIFSIEDQDKTDKLFAYVDLGPSIDSPAPVWTDMPADEALFNYAVNSLDNTVQHFLEAPKHKTFKARMKSYFEHNKYNTEALKRSENLVLNYKNNAAFTGSFKNYAVSGGDAIDGFQHDAVNLAYKWTFNSLGENDGLLSFSPLLYRLFEIDNSAKNTEGSYLRAMFDANDINLGNLTNENLADLFNFGTVYPYGQYKNNIFFEYFSLSDADVGNYLIEKEAVFYVDAGKKKVNPKKETECFDITKPARLTIYVEQPVKGSREITAAIGHTFVGIEQGSISRYLGFYPRKAMPSLISDQVAEIHDNSGSPYHVSISTEVTPDQLKRIIDYIVDHPKTYFLNTYNCSDFGIDIGRKAGLNLPKTIGQYKHFFFKFEGRNPSDLGEDIRAMNPTSTISINKTGGNAPIKTGGCN